MMNITLESVKCATIGLEVLTCLYELEEEPSDERPVFSKTLQFTNGLNGEVYEVSMPGEKTQCFDPITPIINRCVSDHPDDYSEIEKSFFYYRESK